MEKIIGDDGQREEPKNSGGMCSDGNMEPTPPPVPTPTSDTVLSGGDDGHSSALAATQGGTTLGRPGGCKKVPPCYEVMKCYVGLSLVPLVTLICQVKLVSFFAANPVPAWTFLLFTFVYWLIAQTIKKMPDDNDEDPSDSDSIRFRILNQAALVSVSFSTSSLLVFLLPRKLSVVSRHYWILVVLGLAWLLAYCTSTCLRPKVPSAVENPPPPPPPAPPPSPRPPV